MACFCEKIAGKGINLSPTCIGHLWLFQNLGAEEIETLSREVSRKKTTSGQALFMQGDPTDQMFLIKGGRVWLSKVLEDGTELALDVRKAGDFVGENMLSEAGQYPVSAYCLEDTFTCGFSRSQFENLVLRHPRVGLQVLKNICERITRMTIRAGRDSSSHEEKPIGSR